MCQTCIDPSCVGGCQQELERLIREFEADFGVGIQKDHPVGNAQYPVPKMWPELSGGKSEMDEIICTCPPPMWGCTCGAFKREQARKKGNK